MSLPSTSQALAAGARAALRNLWLVAVALPVALLRSAFAWPALLFALGMLWRGAGSPAQGPGGFAGGALSALLAPRSLFTLAGLWLAGALTSGALRIAYLAGALPTLGATLEVRPTAPPRLVRESALAPRFARGLAYGFGPLLGTALLGLAVELAAQLFALTATLAGVLVAFHPPGGARALLPAFLGALTLTASVLGVLLASLVADGALARTALRGEPAARAVGQAVRRVLGRPAAFLMASMVVGSLSLALLGSLNALQALPLGLFGEAPAIALAGPRLMAMVAATALSALLELWRLGTVASLACAEEW